MFNEKSVPAVGWVGMRFKGEGIHIYIYIYIYIYTHILQLKIYLKKSAVQTAARKIN